jgi:hypothetical protein
VLALGLTVCHAGAVWAGPARAFPPEAKKAVVRFPGDGAVVVGGRSTTLSPGAQIRDIHNRIVLSAAVRGEFRGRVLIDRNGQVHRVWMLTPEELALPDPQ